ncbi:AAA family ATPase [Spirulina major CS-329]|uniref:GumC family protein n=1 Tax=Spirulina TaxID=1154 RepID=UPI00232B3A05|nr:MULTISPECIES: tyrosine-protein kinase domain-containing protein [Spirulina]MDB9494637.1 AAA family ATPase [Spirulina subsalsa CS-330]MDB9505265.1 AAA family ATPase [Spirulina major CS-329]
MTSPLVKRFQVSLDRNKLLGVATSGFVLGLATVVALLPPKPPPNPEYAATATLTYSNPPPTATETGRTLFEQGRTSISSPESLLTEQVVFDVVTELDIKNIERFVKKVEINLPKKETDPPIIQIKFTDNREERATRVLELLLEAMVAQSRTVNTSRLRAQIAALEIRLAEAKTELQTAEQQFYQFMSQQGSSLVAAQDGSLFTAISTSQQQQRDLRFQLEGVTAQIDSIVGQLGLNPSQAALASALSADPIIANLRAQILQVETQLALRSRELRPEHPIMADLLKQKATFDQLLRERADEVVGTDGVFRAQVSEIRRDSSLDVTRQQLANQLVNLQTQKDGLTKQLTLAQQTEQQLRRDYERFPNQQLDKERLQQQLTLKKNFHDFLQAKLVDAQSAEAEAVGSLTIAQPPLAQLVPSTYSPPPGPLMIMRAGVVGAILAGAGVILVLGILDPHLYTASEIRAVFGDRDVLVLGELPILNAPPYREDLPLIQGSNAVYGDQYERFRSTLRRVAGSQGKVILMTSVEENEGKSLTSYNLAIASAHAGQRTLLIEADLRSRSRVSSLNLAVDLDAVAEPLSYYGAAQSCTVLAPDVANLYVIPSAGPQRNAAMLLESSELLRLLQDARVRYDLVILDTPPLDHCNDALLLQPLTDGMVITTRPGVTQKKPLGMMLEQLLDAEIPIFGGVINGSEDVVATEPTPPGRDRTFLPTAPAAAPLSPDVPTPLARPRT